MILLHLGEAASSVGSPLYRVLAEHVPALIAVAFVPVVVWLLRRRCVPLSAGYGRLPANHRFLAWLLLATAAIHLGLVVGEHRPALELLFALDAVAMLVVARRLVLGGRWRLPVAILLSASLLAYAVVVVASEPPDQVGLATKLVELTALALVLRPRRPTRLRRSLASVATLTLVVAMGLAAWIGAFAAAERGGGHGHHGAAVMPGSLVRPSEEREPTRAERRAAARFYRKAAATIRTYRDTALAARDGFDVDRIVGNDFHAQNAKYGGDGRVFEPTRPETLVYAQTKRGPVLLGAVYEMPEIGQHGPRIGGPLTEWHAHENVCISLIPFALSGLVSPFGGCAVGSIAFPITPEEIHLWVAPGAPTRWGELDEEWRAEYLDSLDR